MRLILETWRYIKAYVYWVATEITELNWVATEITELNWVATEITELNHCTQFSSNELGFVIWLATKK